MSRHREFGSARLFGKAEHAGATAPVPPAHGAGASLCARGPSPAPLRAYARRDILLRGKARNHHDRKFEKMIGSVTLKNYGPIRSLFWEHMGQMNLVLGTNGQGKTFLLKALYTATRTLEEYKRGNDNRNVSDILADKLYWTFQVDRLGELVTKGEADPLSFKMNVDNREFAYRFGKDTTKQISILENAVAPRANNSIFIPAKEVLSLHQIILKSREQDKVFGFDDTYYDLARAIRQMPQRGKNYKAFSESRKKLENLLGGKVEFVEGNGRWQFKAHNQRYSIGATSEGIKKISILDTLLSNRYLDNKSIVFIDEPESALHPTAISSFLDIVAELSKCGIQFFFATHSYFVVKKLYLLALETGQSVPVISADGDGWNINDLQDGLPENPIIDESVRLYEREVELSLK